ncbi:hypothetical protein HNR11_002721 [Nesterenkonia sandarakina]|uniref:Uncharacterized protein n=1 Tax=Nesterenkonia sandarakina TaxID=272918 RepID=A0A7Z0EAN5_9MICC|nr:hypothetical protein [Nesterenkonia sandarakina]
MNNGTDGLIFLILGVVPLVFHRPLGSFVLHANTKLYPKAGKALAEHTSPRAMLYPAIAFIVLGVILMIHE